MNDNTPDELNQLAAHLEQRGQAHAPDADVVAALNRLAAAAERLLLVADRQARLMDRRLAQAAAQAADGLVRVHRLSDGSVEIAVRDPAASAKAARQAVEAATLPKGDDEWSQY